MEVSDMIKTIECTLCEHSIVMNNVGGEKYPTLMSADYSVLVD